MTPTHLRVMDFVRDRIERAGFAPTFREIGGELGIGHQTIFRTLDQLVEAGLLEKQTNKRRGLALVGVPDLNKATTGALRAELARRGETLDGLARPERQCFSRDDVACAADGCLTAVPVGHLFCYPHWCLLPADLQASLRRTFARHDRRGYQECFDRAMRLIAASELAGG